MLSIQNLSFGYQDRKVISNLSLEIKARECAVLVGRSGCGKSTLLRLIAGLEKPDEGRVIFQNPATRLRYLFQDYDSFPWLTVWENVRQASAADILDDRKTRATLEEVGLYDHRYKYPAELSGGMRKRLGLARAIASDPQLLLLDEPFSSLDIAIRGEMYDLLEKLRAKHGTTIILISHDLHEALLLSDRLLLLSDRPMGIATDIKNELPHPRDASIVKTGFYQDAYARLLSHLQQGN